MATCLATGIITDTRNLSVNCDNPELLLILYELLSRGVDKKRIVDEALEMVTADAFRLRLFALGQRMELLEKFETAIICLSAQDLESHSYVRGDTEGVVNEPLAIRGGGHLQAAGGEFHGSLEEAARLLREALPRYAAKYSNAKKKQ